MNISISSVILFLLTMLLSLPIFVTAGEKGSVTFSGHIVEETCVSRHSQHNIVISCIHDNKIITSKLNIRSDFSEKKNKPPVN